MPLKFLLRRDMTTTELISEWTRYCKGDMRLNVLQSIERNDGPKVLQGVLKGLGLESALDVVQKCK